MLSVRRNLFQSQGVFSPSFFVLRRVSLSKFTVGLAPADLHS